MQIVRRFFCRRGWHKWEFIGDGLLILRGNLMVAHGDQRCDHCGKRRKKSFVVGER